MKKVKFLSTAVIIGLLFTACSKDNNDTPEPVNESEVITTLDVVLTPSGGGTALTLQSRDLDGDGPNAPVITVSGNMTAGTTYNGTVVLLNETVTPAEIITEEVEAESLDHQFFFVPNGNLNVTTQYLNFDTDGNPLGTQFSLIAGTASSGTLTITLRHQPMKPNNGTLTDAGGETDYQATFNVTVQ